MDVAIYLSLILISIAVVAVILLQGKKSGVGGSAFGVDSIQTSRRGVEKTLFNITVGLMIAFVLLDIIAVLYAQ